MYKKNILVNCMVRRQSAEIFAYEMTQGLIQNGCNVYAIIPESIENLEKWKNLNLKKLVVIRTYTSYRELIKNTLKLFLTGEYQRIKNEFKSIRIDAVYVSMLNLWTGIINTMFPKSKKFITLHDPIAHSGANKVRTFIDDWATRQADCIIILTERFREHVKQKYKLTNEQVLYIPHGNYSYYKEYVQTAYYPYFGRVNFLFFGRIEKYKGLNLLAEAYKSVYAKHNDVSLVVAGNGDFSDYQRVYSALPNTEVLNRWIDDSEIGYFFSGENIVAVLPYTDATQSGVIPIAMDYGCAIVAADTGGLSEQVRNEYTGLLFEAKNVNALVDAMLRIYEDENLRSKLVSNAKEELKKLDWNVLSRQLAEYIEKV